MMGTKLTAQTSMVILRAELALRPRWISAEESHLPAILRAYASR